MKPENQTLFHTNEDPALLQDILHPVVSVLQYLAILTNHHDCGSGPLNLPACVPF